jgi:hypothetical protein
MAAAVTAATTQMAGRVVLVVARLLINGHHLLVRASATRAFPPTLPACFSMLCLAASIPLLRSQSLQYNIMKVEIDRQVCR